MIQSDYATANSLRFIFIIFAAIGTPLYLYSTDKSETAVEKLVNFKMNMLEQDIARVELGHDLAIARLEQRLR